MEVGILQIFQNYQGRFDDGDVVRNELRLAERAEALGFDKVWAVEHHFTDYAACPDNFTYLSWVASRAGVLERQLLGDAGTTDRAARLSARSDRQLRAQPHRQLRRDGVRGGRGEPGALRHRGATGDPRLVAPGAADRRQRSIASQSDRCAR